MAGLFFIMAVFSYSKPSDTASCYTKEVFEDFDGTLWIRAQNSISRVVNGKLKRHNFEDIYTGSYFRSFMFIEDSCNNLIISSWQGLLFRYDKKSDTFIQTPYSPAKPRSYINQLSFAETRKIMAYVQQQVRKLWSDTRVFRFMVISNCCWSWHILCTR